MESRSQLPAKPFVSRENELERLESNLSWVLKNQKPHIIFVHGDFGVGKTTLIEAFLQNVENKHKNILIGKGKCSNEGQESGRIPFIQVLNEVIGKSKEGLTREKVLIWAKSVIPAWADFVTFGWATPIITTIDESINLIKDTQKPKTVFMENQIFVQFTNAVAELSKPHGAIIFIDDLHWSDESSLSLIFHMMNNLVDRSVMIICTYRTYDVQRSPHATLFNRIYSNLHYKSMAFEDIELEKGIDVFSYAIKRYGRDTIPAAVLGEIQQKCDGLPIFVVELFNLWEQNHFLQTVKQPEKGNLTWQLNTNVELSIPNGIKELLKERFRLLDNELKNILTGASVEGEDFSAQAMEKLFAVDRLLLYDELGALERKFNLIKERGSERISTVLFDLYRFAHRFIREYIYHNEIPAPKRREMHRRLGECLEAICQDPNPIASQIARHLREAEEPERAVGYMFMAARYEASRFSWAECQNWCRQGLSILEKLKGDQNNLKIEFLEQLSDSFHFTSKYEEAVDALSKAIDIGEKINLEPQKLLHLYGSLADTFEQMEDYDRNAEVIKKGKGLIKIYKIPLCESRINLNLGEGLLKVRLGKLDAAIKILKKSAEDAKNIDQDISGKRLLGEALNCLGVAYSIKGDYKNSVRLFRSAADHVESTGDTNLQAYYMVNLIDDLYWLTGNSDELKSIISEVKKLVYQIGDIDSEAYLSSVEGNVYLRDQKYELAEISLKKAIDIWRRLNIEKLGSQAYSDLALVYLGKGDLDKALANVLKAVELASHDTVKGYGLDALGIIEFQRGDHANSLVHLRDAIKLLKDDNSLHFAARAQRHYAEVLTKLGKEGEAVKIFSEAIATFHDLGLEQEEAITEERMKQIPNTPSV